MLKAHHNVLVGTLCLFNTVLAYPQPNLPVVARADKFIIGSMGDSWASGVTYPALPSNAYDDNKDNCLRYKYAWSTVVHSNYAKWAPADAPSEAELEFRACSGSSLGENINHQMDLMSRPKLVLMEAGGNNANFYPLADACLFHAESGKDYGKTYEDDNGPPGNRESECRREIDLVRGRLTGNAMADFQEEIKKQIHAWRGHKSVMNNDATLLTIGYARFFAEGPECNGYTFTVPTRPVQNVTLEMRKEINELIGYMNDAIRFATDSFGDDKIQYVNIDAAFQDHRFCEPGSSKKDNYNWNNNVWIWNNPLRWGITITEDTQVSEYQVDDDAFRQNPAHQDLYESLIDHQDGPATTEGEYTVVNYRDPENSKTKMTIKFKTGGDVGVLNGSRSRTLHPTQVGHNQMGEMIVERLKQVMQGSQNPATVPTLCPSGCTCDGIVPVCS